MKPMPWLAVFLMVFVGVVQCFGQSSEDSHDPFKALMEEKASRLDIGLLRCEYQANALVGEFNAAASAVFDPKRRAIVILIAKINVEKTEGLGSALEQAHNLIKIVKAFPLVEIAFTENGYRESDEEINRLKAVIEIRATVTDYGRKGVEITECTANLVDPEISCNTQLKKQTN